MDDGRPYPVGVDQLTAWPPYVLVAPETPRVQCGGFVAGSTTTRLMSCPCGPLMQQALVEWGEQALYVALDTSMLWNTYCLIRLSVIYRGRAVPLVWCVLEHGECTGGFPRPTERESSWIGLLCCCLDAAR